MQLRTTINCCFLNVLNCDSQEYYTPIFNFEKDFRNISLTNSNTLLKFLRNKHFSLSDLDYLIFSPERTRFGEENKQEIIMNEFFFPESKVCSLAFSFL